jgi:predicted nucleic acid-binding protein
MELAAAKLFRAKWSDAVQDEWKRNLLENRSDLTEERLERTRVLMNKAIPDANVSGYEDLITGLTLPDPDDRHVLAAAIASECDAIITFNHKDFPVEYLGKFNIELLHPDDFIHCQFGFDNASAIVAAQRCRARLKNPPITAEEYIVALDRLGLPKTANELCIYGRII